MLLKLFKQDFIEAYEYSKDKILPIFKVIELRQEYDELQQEYIDLNNKYKDKYYRDWAEEDNIRAREIRKRQREINKIIYDHERNSKYFSSKEGLATQEDWDKVIFILQENTEFEFEDLEVEVEGEWDDGDRSGTAYGTINHFTLTIEPDQELVAEYIGKKVEEVTKADLEAFDEDDYYDYIYDKFFEEAQKAAEKAWDDGDLDWDDVSWDDPDDDRW